MGQQEPCLDHRMGFFPYQTITLQKPAIMKKESVIFIAVMFLAVCFVGFVVRRIYWFHHDHNLSFNVRETDNVYQLSASFARSKTHSVQRYIDDQLHMKHFFANADMNATVTLDDKTNFYIKTTPGALFIKLDKNENDFHSYSRIKELAEGLKHKLTEN